MQGAQKPERVESIPASEVPGFFNAHARDFAPDAVYRAKTWGRFDTDHQLWFVDVGLMPLVESETGQAIERLIERSVSRLKAELGLQQVTKSQGHWVLQSVFWLVSAKILRDKEVPGFIDLDLLDVHEVFERVATHYNTERIPIRHRTQTDALRETARAIERFAHLGLATTESLGHVYENALISKKTRSELATHSTPTCLVDYVVGKLAPWIEEIPLYDRNVFEPACGHAAFLVSAMRLLTELLPHEKAAPSSRRRYLRPRLHGCDIDPFALEIARLSLTLTDIPNPDGWDLRPVDMFLDEFLENQSQVASIVLANPPFGRFSPEERTRYAQAGSPPRCANNKAAELLRRILPNLAPGAVAGLVIPRGLLVNKNLSEIRRLILQDFDILEICQFPDKMFRFSDAESAVLLARKLRRGQRASSQLRYRRVREEDMEDFRHDYAATTDRVVQRARFSADSGWNMNVPDLEEVWQYCEAFQRLRDIAKTGNGFNFRGADELAPGVTTYSDVFFEGATRGFIHFDCIHIHELPTEKWVNLDPEAVAAPRLGTAVGVPQVILNYAAGGRSPWRLRGLIDEMGHPVTTRFLVIRPRDQTLPLDFLWALINGPLANAYAYTHLGKRDNTLRLIQDIPVPVCESPAVDRVASAAREYRAFVSNLTGNESDEDEGTRLLLRMDAELLRLYNLTPTVERTLLDFMSRNTRNGVPIQFRQYFPAHFQSHISLYRFLSIRYDWESVNTRRGALIQKKVAGSLSAKERFELKELQALASARRRLVAPLPVRELEQLKSELAVK